MTTTTVKTKNLGIDVAKFQIENVAYYKPKYCIVQMGESTDIPNPKAYDQIKSSLKNNIPVMGYFFGTFANSASQARAEARYSLGRATRFGLPKGTYFAVDWEQADNNVNGNVQLNTNAVLAAMNVIKSYGYKPLLYTGKSVALNNIYYNQIVKKYGNCLWIANYATLSRIDYPDFNWFPAMDGVLIWQFTDNWKGLNVDGNVNVLPLDFSYNEENSNGDEFEMTLHPVIKWDRTRDFVVTNQDGCNLYNNYDLKHAIKRLQCKSSYEVLDEKDGALELGKNQWVDGRAGVTKSNPFKYDSDLSGRVKIILPNTHALYSPTADSDKAYLLAYDNIYHVVGRKGRFFILRDKYKGKTVYVTGNRAYVVL